MDPGQFPAFQPLPLLRGGHAQTILGAYLRSPVPPYTAIRRTVKLQDGDFIVLHDDAPSGGLVVPPDSLRKDRDSRPSPSDGGGTAPADGTGTAPTEKMGEGPTEKMGEGPTEKMGEGPAEAIGKPPAERDRRVDRTGPADWQASDRVVLLLHGLGGSYRSGYMPRLAARLNAHGFRTFRMDLRGWGAGQHVARKTAHAGMSDDVEAALRFVARLCPKSPITLIGFSLGGNLALKLAGEAGDRPPAGLDSVLAVAPPIDLVQCANNIKQGLNWIYDRAFVQSLHRNLRQRGVELPDPLDVANLPARLYQFDDQITAPLNGFHDAEQYYRRSSAGPRLADIRVRTLIITAADDPIVPSSMFRKFRLSKHVRLHVTRHGGHLGFIGRAGEDPDHRWLDWRVLQAIQHWDRQARALITSVPPPAARSPRAGSRLTPGERHRSPRRRRGNRPRAV